MGLESPEQGDGRPLLLVYLIERHLKAVGALSDPVPVLVYPANLDETVVLGRRPRLRERTRAVVPVVVQLPRLLGLHGALRYAFRAYRSDIEFLRPLIFADLHDPFIVGDRPSGNGHLLHRRWHGGARLKTARRRCRLRRTGRAVTP